MQAKTRAELRAASKEAEARAAGLHADAGGFDVTAVIGSVRFGEGEETAGVAAFRIIGQHDAEGTYSFPLSNGQTCHVTVEHSGNVRENEPREDSDRF